MSHCPLSSSSSLLARIAVGVISGEKDCEMQRSAGRRTVGVVDERMIMLVS